MQASDPSAQEPRATDVAYRRLIELIVTLELKPGCLLNEAELAQRVKATRPTLVPALHRIAETGLISILPRRGIQVAPVHITDVQQVFDARLTLETGLAGLAAQRASPARVEEITRMERQIDQIDASNANYEVYLEHDRRLHLGIAELSNNSFLVAAIERVWNVNLRLWHLFFQERGGRGPYYIDHSEIVRSIVARDPKGAREAVTDHILKSKELLQSGLWDSYAPEAYEVAIGDKRMGDRSTSEHARRGSDASASRGE